MKKRKSPHESALFGNPFLDALFMLWAIASLMLSNGAAFVINCLILLVLTISLKALGIPLPFLFALVVIYLVLVGLSIIIERKSSSKNNDTPSSP